MHLPMRYRPAGEAVWTYGMSQNISSSGVLCRTSRMVGRDTVVDIEVVLPGTQGRSARVLSRGAVVRTLDADESGDGAIVVWIRTYEFLPVAEGTAPAASP